MAFANICMNPVITNWRERARHVRAPTEKGLSSYDKPFPTLQYDAPQERYDGELI